MSLYTQNPGAFEFVSGITYITARPISWQVGRYGSGFMVIVPRDFSFDVSIPRWLRWLFSPHESRYFKAAALHDWLLQKEWDRMTAGAIFHDALRADGVSKWRALAMWLAVSLWRYR